MKFEYPLLTLEHVMNEAEYLGDKTECKEFHLLLIDKEDCSDCPKDCNRSRDQVLCDLKEALSAIISEFLSYQQYLVTIDGQQYYMWLSPGRLQFLLSNGTITDYEDCNCEIESYTDGGAVKINEWKGTLDQPVVGWFVTFKLCICNNTDVMFNYDTPNVPTHGLTKCSDCGS